MKGCPLNILQCFKPYCWILLKIFLILILSDLIVHGQSVLKNDNKNDSTFHETHLIDCESKVNSLSKFKPPDLEIVFGNWTPLLKYSGNRILVKKDKNEAFDLIFCCKAMYPVQLLHELNSHFFEGKGMPNEGSWDFSFRNKVFYTDFYDPSTYEFYVRDTMRFFKFNMKSQTFSCQSIENPCLQHTAALSFSNESLQLHIELNPSSKLGYPLSFMNTTETDKIISNETDCEAFYYYELVGSGESTPTYKFRCEFADGSPGLIYQIECNHLLKCEAVQRYKPQQNGCWREYNATNGDCEGCQYEIETVFTAFAATCRKGSVGMSDYQETLTSSLAFYGVSQGENSTRPKIFFSMDHINQSEMIYLKTFPEEFHQLGSLLHTQCILSGYYTSAAVQFALEIEGQKGLQLLPLPPEGQTNWISTGIGAWKNKIDITLSNTRIKKVYCFGQIQNTYEWINASRRVYFATPDDVNSKQYQFIMSVFSFGLAALLLFVVVPCLFLIFIKREKTIVRNLTQEEMNGFLLGNSELWKDNEHNSNDNSRNIYKLPYDKKYEVPRKWIDLGKMEILGSGEFGMVYKGTLRQPGSDPIKIAVKMVKMVKNPDLNVQNFLEFLDEIKIMTYLGKHENIVCLIRACTSSMQRCEAYACLEYCKNGSLKNYLPKHKSSFDNLFITKEVGENLSSLATPNTLSPYVRTTIVNGEMKLEDVNSKTLSTLDLLRFAGDIANGMNYLTEMKVCHGDLALRNILLTEDLRAKVGDFGMSIKIDRKNSNYVIKAGHKPWKWSSPESLINHQYSVKSDVFSYGVVLYEIFSLGDEPWEGMEEGEEFKTLLRIGERMEKPDQANDSMYSLMLKCWRNAPSERPSFMEILQEIQDLRPTNNYTVDNLSPHDNYGYVEDEG